MVLNVVGSSPTRHPTMKRFIAMRWTAFLCILMKANEIARETKRPRFVLIEEVDCGEWETKHWTFCNEDETGSFRLPSTAMHVLLGQRKNPVGEGAAQKATKTQGKVIHVRHIV